MIEETATEFPISPECGEDESRSCLVAVPAKVKPSLSTCPSLMNIMGAGPVFGGSISLLWPVGGMALGALANRWIRNNVSPVKRLQLRSQMIGFGSLLTASSAFFLWTKRGPVPETNRQKEWNGGRGRRRKRKKRSRSRGRGRGRSR